MIAYLEGKPLRVGLDATVLIVGGVGYLVKATPVTLSHLRVGVDAGLHTTMIVREDSMTIYGFLEPGEREMFDTLLGVSGIGPKVALAILSVLTPDEVRRAVHAEDLAVLTRPPGIAKRGAQRLVLELKGKIADAVLPTSTTSVMESGSADEDAVVTALIGLGWGDKIARDAVTQVVTDEPENASEMATLLRAALRNLGGKR